MSNEQCKDCLIYKTMPNKDEIEYMTAYCGLSKHSICPCFHCLVKVMCGDACSRFKEWRSEHPFVSFTKSGKHWGRFYE